VDLHLHRVHFLVVHVFIGIFVLYHLAQSLMLLVINIRRSLRPFLTFVFYFENLQFTPCKFYLIVTRQELLSLLKLAFALTFSMYFEL